MITKNNSINPLISSDELKIKFAEFARNSNSRLSIILGAGASYGYSRNTNYIYRPPTVYELLKNDNPLVNEVIENPKHYAIKGQRAHIERSIKGLNGDLEAYLSDIYANDTADNLFPSMLQYLEDIFTLASQRIDLDDNHYQSLLNRVRDLRGTKPWSIITFNYDTLLEQSLVNIPRFIPRRTFLTDNNYLDQNPKVLKMHGSVNLRYITIPPSKKENATSSHDIFTEMMSRKESVENYLEVKGLGLSVPSFQDYRRFKDGLHTTYNFPLMMIPIHTAVRSENSFFKRQIEYAKSDISESKLVLAIGYQFGDNTFIDALKDLNLKESALILIGSKHLLEKTIESKAYREASKAWPKENIKIYDKDGFGNFTNALY